MMPIHREGYSTLAVVAVSLLVINSALFLVAAGSGLIVGIVSLGILVFFAQFFRNPERNPPSTESGVIAPADGTIVAAEKVAEAEYFKDERLKLSIYMSALNVHLNRVPIHGRVVYHQYHPGRYLVAFHPKASELNERNTVVLERGDGQQILVRQIAGLLARRIRFYLRAEQAVQAGDELGFIKFGSRCDVFLPLKAEIRVKIGDKVKGGETILADINLQ